MQPPPLRDYQEETVQRVLAGASLIALEQGLGKTRVALEVAQRLDARRVLIVCPLSVRAVWRAEIRKFWKHAPNIDMPFLLRDIGNLKTSNRRSNIDIVNFDKISRGTEFADALVEWGPYDLLIIDESHFLKTPSSVRTKAIYGKLAPVAKRTICLSGTPCPNHAGELYTFLRALAPDIIRTSAGNLMTLHQFEDAFCDVEMKHFGAGRPVRVIKGSRNMDLLRKKIAPVIVRKMKKDVLKELPPLEFVHTPLIPTSDCAATLNEYSSLIGPDMSDEDVLRNLNSREEHFMRLRAALGIAKSVSAVLFLQDFMYDSDRKIVVWAEHKGVIDRLMEGLAEFGAVKIDGSTSVVDRAIAVEKFLEDPKTKVFVGNITAAGTGLTLVGPNCPCSDVFFVETGFVPGNMLQAACRVHRLGQNDGVLARVFVATKTIDERIQSILARKETELSQLFG